MIKRLRHSLSGHSFTIRIGSNPPSNPHGILCGSVSFFAVYGMTTIVMTCPCGAVKLIKWPGQMATEHAPEHELSELRKMVGL